MHDIWHHCSNYIYLHKMVHGKEIPWYWCFIVMMVVENTYFIAEFTAPFTVTNYTEIIKDAIKHQHMIIHAQLRFFITE